MNSELEVVTPIPPNIIGDSSVNQNIKSPINSSNSVEETQLTDNGVVLVVTDVQQCNSTNTESSDQNRDLPNILTPVTENCKDVEMVSQDTQKNIQSDIVTKPENDMTNRTSLISVSCLNGQQNGNIGLEGAVVVDANNNYTQSNLNDYPTSLSPKPAVQSNVIQDKISNNIGQTEIYHPSTTTVNLSESNQSVYFMMQTASAIDLLASQPVSTTIPPHNNVATLNNNSSNGPVKLKSSPTSTPTVAKKLYSPKHLDGSQIMANPVNSSVMILNSSSLSSSSSPLNVSPNGANKIVRDERRRANHNEVERRRRDNINKWIVELSKVIPDCSNDQSKHGQSKGGILEKTVQYLSDIKKTNQELHEHIRSMQMVKQENAMLREQNEMYRKDNEFLKRKLSSSTVLMESLEDLQNSIELGDNHVNHQQNVAATSSISSSSSASNCKRL